MVLMMSYLVTMLKVSLLSALLLSSAFADRPRGFFSERVVGGTPTTIEQWPFIVGMLFDWSNSGVFTQSCGGSILTSRHILSAAHCYQDSFNIPHRWQIRAGSTFRTSGGIVVAVSSIIHHPQYNGNTLDNDVTVLTLSNNLPLGLTIAQASIPSHNYIHPDNAVSYALGWGSTSSGGSSSEVLLQGEVRTISQSTCVPRYGMYGLLVSDTMFCAGLLDIGGVDACQGDSGGPLVYNNIVIGITSWGMGCAQALFPGVYARVSAFTDWIVLTVNNS